MLVCCTYFTFMEAVQAVIGSIMVVSALTHCVLLHCECTIWKPHRWARSGWPKTMDSEAVLQAIKTNLLSSTQRVSSELSISSPSQPWK